MTTKPAAGRMAADDPTEEEGAMSPAEGTGAAEGGALETVTLGGGCFWCLEPVFAELRGVERVVCGYAGGHLPNPSYREVCGGDTGHAEVVQLTFDPEKVSLRRLLKVFFSIHDPTTPNRQGPDVGAQYRSAVFYHSPEQKRVTEEVIAELEAEGVWGAPVVTEVSRLEAFYPAESYHQGYFRRNPSAPYCTVMIAPKLSDFRRRFAAELKKA